jgi:hypothetical protein
VEAFLYAGGGHLVVVVVDEGQTADLDGARGSSRPDRSDEQAPQEGTRYEDGQA